MSSKKAENTAYFTWNDVGIHQTKNNQIFSIENCWEQKWLSILKVTFLSEGERAKNKNRDWFHFWTQYTDNDDTWKKVLIKSWHTAHRIILLGISIFNKKNYWITKNNHKFNSK